MKVYNISIRQSLTITYKRSPKFNYSISSLPISKEACRKMRKTLTYLSTKRSKDRSSFMKVVHFVLSFRNTICTQLVHTYKKFIITLKLVHLSLLQLVEMSEELHKNNHKRILR